MSQKSPSRKKVLHLEWREIPGLIKEAFLEFLAEKGLFHGAALAYYTLFAMVPLFYLCIAFFGKIIGQEVMLEIISNLLRNQIGIQDVNGIMEFLSGMDFEKGNFMLEIVSMVALLIASSAFLVALKQSINEFFDLEVNYSTKRKAFLNNVLFRLISVLFVGLITVVVIVIYFSQTILLSTSSEWFPDSAFFQTIFSGIATHGLALLLNVIIFTLVFKYVHDGYVKWKLAFGGAILTSILLYGGQLLIKYYLFNYFFAAEAGIAGSMFIILAWIYYSSQIIFFGAKFTCVYAKKVGKPISFSEDFVFASKSKRSKKINPENTND
jgi:membrane protein